jgi:hypothetical protein
LFQQFHAVHLGFGTTSAVVSTPFPPKRPAEVFRRSQRFVARNRACGVGFPGLGVLAGRDNGIGTSVGDGIVALARILGAICRDAADLLLGRDLIQQFWQYRRIANVAAGELDCPDFLCLFVDTEVNLAPHAPFRATRCPAVEMQFR